MAQNPANKNFTSSKLISPIKELIHDSRTTGIVLIFCSVISLLISNGRAGRAYLDFWNKKFNISFGILYLPNSYLHIINDLLMAVFFLLVGMEIKRELLIGELSSLKKSLLPILGAIGGMLLPAIIYMIWCGNTPYYLGWGIPMATDIAFSLGVLSLLGSKKAPLSLRIFLVALAIIDDLGGIMAIAIFYTRSINLVYLLFAGLAFGALLVMNKFRVKYLTPFIIVGLILWYCIYQSGIHATIAGVLVAFSIPLHQVQKMEHRLHIPVNFLILPLFALANTAIVLPTDFSKVLSSPVHYGILMGLFIGKPVGIFLFCYIAVKWGIASLPHSIEWKQLLGTAMLAGIGFTMSIFIATLAFNTEDIQIVAKIAIISASIVSGTCGYIYLSMLGHKKEQFLK
ncbi:MAG: Na+/H+ antiporter NhaA [Bacteroidota bacterium]